MWNAGRQSNHPPAVSQAYLVFTSRAFLLLLDEVRRRSRRRSSPHAANDSNAVLRERGETQLLALMDLYVLKLLKAAKCKLTEKTGCTVKKNYDYVDWKIRQRPPHQYTLPQQQQHLLHWEMGGVTTAELGHHTEEHDRNGLIVEKRRSWVRKWKQN